MDSENTLMTEITIRDYGSSNLVHYTIRVDNWEMDDWATTLDGAFKCITHNLKCDCKQHERDLEDV